MENQIKQTGFDYYEEKGRELFKKICAEQIVGCKVIKESTDKMAHWDMAATIKGKPIIIEIKVRNYLSTTFQEWYYESYKHTQLLKLKEKADKKKETDIFYVNFFEDNAFRIWKTNNIHTTQQTNTVMTQQTTVGNKEEWVATKVYSCDIENEYMRGEIEEEIFKNHPTGQQEDITDFTNPFNR